MTKLLTRICVFLYIVRHTGKDRQGEYETDGINRYNPLAYLLMLIIAIIGGIYGFVEYFIYTIKAAWSEK